jgi:hypothetical protein
MEMDEDTAEENRRAIERRRRFDRVDPRPLLNRQMADDRCATDAANDRINRIAKRQRRGKMSAEDAARLIAEQERIKARAKERRWRCCMVWADHDVRGTA